jgi:predicted TIM-barrel fold metal-dependent hydrolase
MFDFSGGLEEKGRDVHGHSHLSLEQAPRVFRKVGIERMIFGSDEPAFGLSIRDHAGQVFRMNVSDGEREQLLWRNAAALLQIE